MTFINGDFVIEGLQKFGLTILFTIISSLERETHDHPGGLVTHMLVGLGSCMFALISSYQKDGSDPTRIAANIVSGMGFLGSATVFKSDKYVKGINTAANLWLAAGIGMSVAFDLWELAAIISICSALILYLSNIYKRKKYERRKRKKEEKDLERRNSNPKNPPPASPMEKFDDNNDIILEDFDINEENIDGDD